MSPLEKTKKRLDKTADLATRWIGSSTSLVIHTLFFIGAFTLPLFGADIEMVLLVLTTAVSLEAIYLAIFIQISVNKNTEDIEVIQEDIDEIQVDVDEIQKDVDEIQEDVDEIQEDIEEIGEEQEEVTPKKREQHALIAIQQTLSKLQKEIEALKK